MAQQLVLKRALLSRSSGEWRDDDFDVLENGVIVGRIFKVSRCEPWRPVTQYMSLVPLWVRAG